MAVNYANRFATGPEDAEYPDLWRGLLFCTDTRVRGTGGFLWDYGGNGVHGTLTSFTPGADWVSTAEGISLAYNGTSKFVNHGNSARLFVAESFSVVALARSVGTGARYVWGDYNAAGNTNSSFLLQNASNVARFGWENPIATFPVADGTTVIGNDGLWHWLAGTYDHANTLRTIWVDGIAEGTNNTAQARADVGGTLTIGRAGEFSGVYWSGNIATVMLYDRCLTGNEVLGFKMGRHPLVRRKRRAAWWMNEQATSPPPPSFSPGWATGATCGVLGTGVF